MTHTHTHVSTRIPTTSLAVRYKKKHNAHPCMTWCMYLTVCTYSQGVKGYVTLNVLVFDEELPSVEQYIRNIATAGVDAVIVQVRISHTHAYTHTHTHTHREYGHSLA